MGVGVRASVRVRVELGLVSALGFGLALRRGYGHGCACWYRSSSALSVANALPAPPAPPPSQAAPAMLPQAYKPRGRVRRAASSRRASISASACCRQTGPALFRVGACRRPRPAALRPPRHAPPPRSAPPPPGFLLPLTQSLGFFAAASASRRSPQGRQLGELPLRHERLGLTGGGLVGGLLAKSLPGYRGVGEAWSGVGPT